VTRSTPEARKLVDPPVEERALQLLETVDFEVLVKRAHALRTEAREMQKLGRDRRDFAMELVEERHRPGLGEAAQFRREVLADPREFRKVAALAQKLGDFHAEPAHRPRAGAVGADAEGVRGLQLQQIGDLVERVGDFGVVKPGFRLLPRCGSRARHDRPPLHHRC